MFHWNHLKLRSQSSICNVVYCRLWDTVCVLSEEQKLFKKICIKFPLQMSLKIYIFRLSIEQQRQKWLLEIDRKRNSICTWHQKSLIFRQRSWVTKKWTFSSSPLTGYRNSSWTMKKKSRTWARKKNPWKTDRWSFFKWLKEKLTRHWSS